MRHYLTYRVFAATLVILVGCGRDGSYSFGGDVFRSWNPAAVKAVRGIPVATITTQLQRELTTKPANVSEEQWRHVKRLYAVYRFAPLWLDGDGLIKNRADALVDALVNATTDAIQIDKYPLADLAQNLDAVRRAKDPTAEQLAHADLLLTTAYASLAEDYLTGQIEPRSVAQSWHISTREEEVDSALARSLRDDDLAEAFGRMRPQDYDYEMLRRKLADYRKIVASGGWAPIPAGKALKRGDRDDPARLQALRARLRAEGFRVVIGDSATAGTYDASLAAAVATFQMRHAIGADSALGKETLDALNVPARFRLTQVAANLERYRWLPHALGSKYVLVNVPAFRLQGYENGKKTIEMKVIVGSDFEGRATPVFSDSMEYVIFRPYWDVPPKLADKEIVPGGLTADFLVKTQDGRPLLRQRTGTKNALGLVKFMFPNDFNIYLHDTPNDALFKRDVRAFSHGCIRLEKPDEMATWVLGWPKDRVHQALQGPDDRRVTLQRKIPVYIAYFTAYMRDGALWFGNDLYRRDDQLVEVVAGGAMPSGEAAKAITALRQLTD
jgi:murein L,D-transpeptidase YcbB/YkuD